MTTCCVSFFPCASCSVVSQRHTIRNHYYQQCLLLNNFYNFLISYPIHLHAQHDDGINYIIIITLLLCQSLLLSPIIQNNTLHMYISTHTTVHTFSYTYTSHVPHSFTYQVVKTMTKSDVG